MSKRIKMNNKSLLVDKHGKPISLSAGQYGYKGADNNRYNLDFTTTLWSPSQLLMMASRNMRARAQDLERNNDHVRRFISLVVNNVIGWNGIQLQSKATRGENTETPDRTAIKMIESEWRSWADCANCSVEGDDDFIEIQKLILRRSIVDGEIFVEKLPGFDNEHQFAVRLWAAEAVPHGYNDKDKRILMGIQYDEWMRPIAYFVHPSGHCQFQTNDDDLIKIPAINMVHVFRKERPKQRRGFTYLCSTSERMHMLEKFEKAVLVGAQIASSKMGFFRDPDDMSMDPYTGDGSENPDDDDGPNAIDINPGQFEDIGHKTFEKFDVDYPPADYDVYVHEILRSAASGLNISYHLLANDPGSVNYSTAREFRLQDTDLYRDLQHWFARKVNESIYKSWLQVQLLRQPLNTRYRQRDMHRIAAHKWQPRGWQWVDPAKEGQGNLLAFQMGSKSLSDIASEQGRDFEEVVDQIKIDIAYATEKGLDLSGLFKAPIIFPADEEEEKPTGGQASDNVK